MRKQPAPSVVRGGILAPSLVRGHAAPQGATCQEGASAIAFPCHHRMADPSPARHPLNMATWQLHPLDMARASYRVRPCRPWRRASPSSSSGRGGSLESAPFGAPPSPRPLPLGQVEESAVWSLSSSSARGCSLERGGLVEKGDPLPGSAGEGYPPPCKGAVPCPEGGSLLATPPHWRCVAKKGVPLSGRLPSLGGCPSRRLPSRRTGGASQSEAEPYMP